MGLGAEQYDARAEKCGGPGTWVLTEIEQARKSELLAPAIAEFRAALAGLRLNG
jgi:hypothetical protein